MWAKTSRSNPDGPIDRWLPLTQHLTDAALTAGNLWDRRIGASVKQHVTSTADLSAADARALVVWLAGIHDVGKASPAFAVQVGPDFAVARRAPQLIARMERHGLTLGDTTDRQYARHELVGALAVSRWLADRGSMRRTGESAAWESIVGGHHGLPPSAEQMQYVRTAHRLTGAGTLWQCVQDDLLDVAAERWLNPSLLAALPTFRCTQSVQVLLTGIVVMSDWFASNEALFPHVPLETETLDLGAAAADRRAQQAWDQMDLPLAWSTPIPEPGTLLAERFNLASPRPVQVAAIHAATAMAPDDLMIIEAPMGEGKTEAALAAAEILAARTGASGVAIALPTQATTDAMFTRFKAWLEHLPGEKDLYLAHGQAALNDDYQSLFRRGEATSVAIDSDAQGGVVAHEWLTDRRKGPLSSFMVATIDQVLLAALKSRYLVLRHTGLAGKVVILDEVHAADVFMSRYLERALMWLGAHQVPTILLSATLPSGQRQALYAAYRTGRQSNDPSASPFEVVWPDVGYPAVVTTGADGNPVAPVIGASSRATDVHLEPLPDTDDALVDALTRDLAHGGCAVVIRNTVRRVQHTARLLEEHFPGQVSITHAQFLASDRKQNETRLLGQFSQGPDVVRPRRHIVVASQVIEQSLDVDFDVMVTDLAPADLLLQRMGRLHRHNRPTRPLSVARCYLAGVEDWLSAPPAVEGGTARIYAASLVHRTLGALRDGGHLGGAPVRLPADIPTLVQSVYGAGSLGPATWQPLMRDEQSELAARNAHRVQAADAYRLGVPEPTTSRRAPSLIGWLAAASIDVDDTVRARAQVRDGADSLDVLVVARTSGGELRVPAWADTPHAGTVLHPDREVPVGVAKSIRACGLRLPMALSGPWSIDATIAALAANTVPGWQTNPLLAHRLVLVLDEPDLTAAVGAYGLRYSRTLGLIVTKERS